MRIEMVIPSKAYDDAFADGVDWATPHVWNEAIEAAAEKMEHYRDVVKRSDEDPTEWKAYNIAAAVIRKLLR